MSHWSKRYQLCSCFGMMRSCCQLSCMLTGVAIIVVVIIIFMSLWLLLYCYCLLNVAINCFVNLTNMLADFDFVFYIMQFIMSIHYNVIDAFKLCFYIYWWSCLYGGCFVNDNGELHSTIVSSGVWYIQAQSNYRWLILDIDVMQLGKIFPDLKEFTSSTIVDTCQPRFFFII